MISNGGHLNGWNYVYAPLEFLLKEALTLLAIVLELMGSSLFSTLALTR